MSSKIGPSPDDHLDEMNPTPEPEDVIYLSKGFEPSTLTENDLTQDLREIKFLARTLSQESPQSEDSSNPFKSENPELDPASDLFRPEKWVKAFLGLTQNNKIHMRRKAGVALKNVNVSGSATVLNSQSTVGDLVFGLFDLAANLIGNRRQRVQILHNIDALVHPGELLVALGPPGSGCSTLLKTIAGETHGIIIDGGSEFNYEGISFRDMHSRFRGESIYTAEQDVHLPMLTVGQTLEFVALARAPRAIPGNIPRDAYAKSLRNVIMAVFGIRHTRDSRVGNEFVRGISGGERKRVSIAEAALSGSPLQCWDNSTRGLDSANAIEFCKTLRLGADLLQTAAAVAIYQAPQAAYDLFDKVLILYHGRQIFFGPSEEAKSYFEGMGFECPERQTTPDFLASMTSPTQRRVRSGFENKVPRTPEDFAKIWLESPMRQKLLEDIKKYNHNHPIGGPDFDAFQESRTLQQAKHQRAKSPYTLSYWQQIEICFRRGYICVISDPTLLIASVLSNIAIVTIVSSIFFKMPMTTSTFYSRGALLFFAILINAFSSQLEILTVYAQRPVVEKHARYALYHPSAEALASMLTDLPIKVVNLICFNIVIYWMTGLKKDAGAFFFFLLTFFMMVMVMSSLFRTIASVSQTLTQALAPFTIFILALVIYSGFVIPIDYMHGWARWINYLDPISYGLEALMINEFHDREYVCSNFVPRGPGYDDNPATPVCSSVGSIAGQMWVRGDAYIEGSFSFHHSHKWRNIGIMFGFCAFFTLTYVAATDLISEKKSRGEVAIFPRGKAPRRGQIVANDLENGNEKVSLGQYRNSYKREVPSRIARQSAIIQWQDVCYDLKIKNENTRILDHVEGWVEPGTLTALMGVSGAGKTTLLDVLASRRTIGVISGKILINGRQIDSSFQRKTGYAQQLDLHLETSTVREALNFSASLRQPRSVPRPEKLRYVEEVIHLLEMEEYADAVVGVPGEGMLNSDNEIPEKRLTGMLSLGLNVEQRKRLTIGVELAAKPELLLFLDEPTSGLDSQTSWSILMLLQKLKNNGQAILCTIHQTSAILLQQFDRLLLLDNGGKTVYFGPLGPSASTLLNYFGKNGGYRCSENANPAEYMLEVIGAAPGCRTEIDWPAIWKQSPDLTAVRAQLEEWEKILPHRSSLPLAEDHHSFAEFAASFPLQLSETLFRMFQQYWRTPSYIYSKIGLIVATIMPLFVTQRALYEARERPAKTYSWAAFMLTNIIVEIPWSSLCSVMLYITWYYPIRLYRNAELTDSVHEKGTIVWLFILTFLLFSSTFSHLAISAIETEQTAGNVANLCFSLSISFCGVLAGPKAFPHFWIFMYRISPFHYLISGLLSASVGGGQVVCSKQEFLHFDPPENQTCGGYLSKYIQMTGGYVETPSATAKCSFCSTSETNKFLEGLSTSPDDEWKNFGLMWTYIVFNIFGALFLYWTFRVPKKIKVHETATNSA
ncbi:hypothetical protein N7478_008456 [Penicillium angulare]|uniref:uncharacterized protein n=1 Tax=Penicillium angulare TaxID=116970 RepID=UPI002540C649|nr:uncharacterized protein N7478_008456 [Penicillium angulare]KAJ5273331.1 hypothetical protein N7478_008456 [Penicillium angulare]